MPIELFYYKYCKFTYHIVNIKREGVEIDRLRSDVFTYHIVNIKLL